MREKDLEQKKIVISTHVYTTGPSQDLEKFLINKKIERLLFIGHPLFYNPILKGSGFEIYKKGVMEKKEYAKLRKIPFIVSIFKDVFLNIFWTMRYGRGSDLYIGFDNLNAFSGVVLKFLRLVEKTVYYVVDYNPRRYENRTLNSIYQKIDQFCVKYCDETWNLSPRMEEGRRTHFNFSKGTQRVVPMGVWLDRIQIPDFNDIEEHTLIYSGHVIKKQGIQHVINAIPKILEKIPDFKFTVLGEGPYLEELRKLATHLGIEKHVDFSGYIEKPEEMENRISRCALAVALYEKLDENGNLTFTHYSDPGKLKLYIGCGVPILLTDVPYNAKEIEEKECGRIVSIEPDNIATEVIRILKDEGILKKYRKNVLNYAKKFNWEVIFSDLLCTN